MAKKPNDGFTHESFKDDFSAIGQVAGEIDVFPAGELPARLQKQRDQDRAIDYAIEQSETGFPEEDADDVSDLDD